MLAGSNSDRSPLYDVRNLAAAAQWAAAAKRCFADEGVLALLLSASDRVDQTIWWSQTGSNRRPHACKARALPAELWPRNQKTNASRSQLILRSPSQSATAQQPSFKKACRAEAAKQRRLVGLGRLELPTSRLSSARSNQLSYKPQRSPLHEERSRKEQDQCSRACGASALCNRTSAKPQARVRPRRKRNEDGEIPPMQLNDPDDRWPLMFQKRLDSSKLLKNHP